MVQRQGEDVPPGVLLAFVVVGYGALVVCALGFGSLLTGAEVVATQGISVVAGVLAVLAAVAAFGGSLWPVLRAARPAYPAAAGVMLAAALVYAFALWLLAVVFGADPAAAGSAVRDAVLGWQILAVALPAGAAAWAGIAVRRTRARRPRWPWENDDRDNTL